MKELKNVEYDDIECSYNRDAVCPYCGLPNYIEEEDYKGQDEETIEECGGCGKKFVHTIDYDIRFSSEPYENWLMEKIARCNNDIKYYKLRITKADHEELDYLQTMLKQHEEELAEFVEEAEKLEEQK
jgi:hypothetical protein